MQNAQMRSLQDAVDRGADVKEKMLEEVVQRKQQAHAARLEAESKMREAHSARAQLTEQVSVAETNRVLLDRAQAITKRLQKQVEFAEAEETQRRAELKQLEDKLEASTRRQIEQQMQIRLQSDELAEMRETLRTRDARLEQNEMQLQSSMLTVEESNTKAAVLQQVIDVMHNVDAGESIAAHIRTLVDECKHAQSVAHARMTEASERMRELQKQCYERDVTAASLTGGVATVHKQFVRASSGLQKHLVRAQALVQLVQQLSERLERLRPLEQVRSDVRDKDWRIGSLQRMLSEAQHTVTSEESKHAEELQTLKRELLARGQLVDQLVQRCVTLQTAVDVAEATARKAASAAKTATLGRTQASSSSQVQAPPGNTGCVMRARARASVGRCVTPECVHRSATGTPRGRALLRRHTLPALTTARGSVVDSHVPEYDYDDNDDDLVADALGDNRGEMRVGGGGSPPVGGVRVPPTSPVTRQTTVWLSASGAVAQTNTSEQAGGARPPTLGETASAALTRRPSQFALRRLGVSAGSNTGVAVRAGAGGRG